MLDEWAPSPWKPVPAEGLTSDPLVATILLTTGAPWVEKESKEMPSRLFSFSLVVGLGPH